MIRKMTSVQNPFAQPIVETKTAESTGPSTAKILRPYRSAKYPNNGCGKDAAIENATAKVAARAIESPNSSMILGSSGGMNDA